MNKIVNIYPKGPITSINPPIYSTVKKVTKSDKEIRACIMNHATVEEVLKDGSIVLLNLTNYNKDNNPVQEEVVPVPETPKKEEEIDPIAAAVEAQEAAKEEAPADPVVEDEEQVVETEETIEVADEVKTEEVVEPAVEEDQKPQDKYASYYNNGGKKNKKNRQHEAEHQNDGVVETIDASEL